MKFKLPASCSSFTSQITIVQLLVLKLSVKKHAVRVDTAFYTTFILSPYFLWLLMGLHQVPKVFQNAGSVPFVLLVGLEQTENKHLVLCQEVFELWLVCASGCPNRWSITQPSLILPLSGSHTSPCQEAFDKPLWVLVKGNTCTVVHTRGVIFTLD